MKFSSFFAVLISCTLQVHFTLCDGISYNENKTAIWIQMTEKAITIDSSFKDLNASLKEYFFAKLFIKANYFVEKIEIAALEKLDQLMNLTISAEINDSEENILKYFCMRNAQRSLMNATQEKSQFILSTIKEFMPKTTWKKISMEFRQLQQQIKNILNSEINHDANNSLKTNTQPDSEISLSLKIMKLKVLFKTFENNLNYFKNKVSRVSEDMNRDQYFDDDIIQFEEESNSIIEKAKKCINDNRILTDVPAV